MAKTFKYIVEDPGEYQAGILPLYDTVTIVVEYNPGGDDSGEYSFQEFMLQSLREWFDTTGVALIEVNDNDQ